VIGRDRSESRDLEPRRQKRYHPLPNQQNQNTFGNSGARSTNRKVLHPLLWLVCRFGKRPVGDKRNTKNKFGNKANILEQSKKVKC
jgi:hypothetical protein